MKELKNILTQTYEFAQDLKFHAGRNPVKQIQATCRVWSLKQMLNAIDTIECIQKKFKAKQK